MSSDLWIPWCFLHHSVNGCLGLGVFFTSFAVFLISVYSHTTLLHSSFVTASLSSGLLPSSLSQLHNNATKVRKNQTAGRIMAVHKNTTLHAQTQKPVVKEAKSADNSRGRCWRRAVGPACTIMGFVHSCMLALPPAPVADHSENLKGSNRWTMLSMQGVDSEPLQQSLSLLISASHHAASQQWQKCLLPDLLQSEQLVQSWKWATQFRAEIYSITSQYCN